MIRAFEGREEDVFFWGVHGQGELDLLILKDGKRLGFEMKYTDHPRMTKSLHQAYSTLGLTELSIIYPGTTSYRLDTQVNVIGLSDLCRQVTDRDAPQASGSG